MVTPINALLRITPKHFSNSLCARPPLGPTKPPVQRVLEVLSPEVKRGRGVVVTIHTIQCRGREWAGAVPPLHPSASMACRGTALLFYLLRITLYYQFWPVYPLYDSFWCNRTQYHSFSRSLHLDSNFTAEHVLPRMVTPCNALNLF
jgi:hypothetical protein